MLTPWRHQIANVWVVNAWRSTVQRFVLNIFVLAEEKALTLAVHFPLPSLINVSRTLSQKRERQLCACAKTLSMFVSLNVGGKQLTLLLAKCRWIPFELFVIAETSTRRTQRSGQTPKRRLRIQSTRYIFFPGSRRTIHWASDSPKLVHKKLQADAETKVVLYDSLQVSPEMPFLKHLNIRAPLWF